jgi:hypothetical protein
MQEIREALFDFSKMEEESWPELLAAQEQVLSADFAAASLDNSVPPQGGVRDALVESEAAREVDVERSMEPKSVEEEDCLPGDKSDEQWLRANSDNDPDNLTLCFTDQVRKWYRQAVCEV